MPMGSAAHIEISLSECVGKLVKKQALAKDIGLHQRPALPYHLRPAISQWLASHELTEEV